MDESFRNKRALVTGGAGFIGSNLAKKLVDLGAKVTVFDKFDSPESLGNFRNLFFEDKLLDVEILSGDISCDLHLLEGSKFDYIFHQAAISDTTFSNSSRMLEVNYYAFCQILKMGLEMGAKVIYASSAAVYGNSSAPNTVGMGESPLNIYGFSKLLMDKKTQSLLEQDNSLPIFGLRYFNVYGPKEIYKGKTASMIYQLSKQILESRIVRLFEFGEQQRDFVYVDDVVSANLCAARAGDNGGGGGRVGGIYNVASGISSSFNEIVEILKVHLGDFDVEYIKNPYAFFQKHTLADISNTRALGYAPRWSLAEGIKDYLDKGIL